MPAPSPQKVVLVTGGTDGLGKATAILLAQHRYRVIAAGRSEAKRTELDALAKTKNLPLTTVELDVCSDVSVRRAVQSVIDSYGAIDVLIKGGPSGNARAKKRPHRDLEQRRWSFRIARHRYRFADQR